MYSDLYHNFDTRNASLEECEQYFRDEICMDSSHDMACCLIYRSNIDLETIEIIKRFLKASIPEYAKKEIIGAIGETSFTFQDEDLIRMLVQRVRNGKESDRYHALYSLSMANKEYAVKEVRKIIEEDKEPFLVHLAKGVIVKNLFIYNDFD